MNDPFLRISPLRLTLVVAVVAVVALLTVAGIRFLREPDGGPIPSDPPGADSEAHLESRERAWTEVDFTFTNPSTSPARITYARLIPGGQSQNLPTSVEITGPGRSPLLGDVIQATDDGEGVKYVEVWFRPGAFDDVSFGGVELEYVWQGQLYTALSRLGVTLCRATPSEQRDDIWPAPCDQAE